MSESVYSKRLAKGSATGWVMARTCTLWLGPDHLLHARRSNITETYRRLFFKDIQAITLAKTDTGRTINLLLALLMGVMLAIVFYATGDWNLRIVWGAILCAVPASILTVNSVLLGPTCACYFHTAVQQEHVIALSRLRKARAVLAILEPLLQQAQGALDSAELESLRDADRLFTLAADDAKKGRKFHTSAARYHGYFFGLVLLTGVTACVDLVWRNEVKDILDTILMLGAMVLGFLAFHDQTRSLIHLNLQRITTVTLSLLTGGFAGGILIGSIWVGISMAGSTTPDFNNLPPSVYVYSAALGTVLIALSLIGLMRLRRYQEAMALFFEPAGEVEKP